MSGSHALTSFVCVFLVSGCATGSESAVVSKSYPAVAIEHVVILFSPPAQLYEELAMVSSYERGSDTFAANQQKAIERLKKAAATVGADAIVLTVPAPQGTAQVYDRAGRSLGMAGPTGDITLNGIAIKYK
jgi:hypothetical protein